MSIGQFGERFEALAGEVNKVLLGQHDVVDHVLVALFAGGHVLVEGVPGLGKTLLVRALGSALSLEFKRVQFTPDLMPSDVTGGNIFDQQEQRFVFMPGPVFTQLLLADEVNRAPAKTQAALLEAMQERSVTTDGETRPLPEPFLVIATQNPVESQGTYPLPEAQLDRFLFKVSVDHPSREVEEQILSHYVQGFDPNHLRAAGVQPVLGAAEIAGMQRSLLEVRVAPEILRYVTEIVGRTRSHGAVYLGASPRGSVGLLMAARVHAASQGRDFVVPDDVKRLAPATLRHRVILQPDAELEGVTADDCVESILRDVVVPKNVA